MRGACPIGLCSPSHSRTRPLERWRTAVRELLPGRRVWVSTFHRFCARLLREYGEVVGLKSTFSILDTADQKQTLRLVMNELDLDTVHYSPGKIAYRISNAKNDLITPELFLERYQRSVGDHLDAIVSKVYPDYQRHLLEANSVDFDDLLLHTVMLLEENPELRRQLDERFRYILVDEYQDTNNAQYRIVAALSQQHRNLCVTGDPDQSIYGWRGARIENILRFERDYPDAKTVRLEQNFRSTQAILRSADSLIANNAQRKAKTLYSEKHDGPPVRLLRFPNGQTEAEAVALIIREMVDTGDYAWNQIAIFYRVNALSRALESAFIRHRIPYQVAAGVAFYDRAEVKDLLAYLRLIENPADRAAFFRVVNKPLRGLGKTSQNRLTRWAETQHLTLLEAAARAGEVPKLSKRAQTGFRAFASMIERFSLADAGSIGDLLVTVLDKTRYTAPWEGSESEADREHLANVQELLNAARQYDAVAGEKRSLQGFLEQTALVSDTDRIDSEAGQVTLMTLHAAKGLEFPVVFIVGFEQGLIPHERSMRENATPHDLEEERRLLFVGMTRAEERLHLTESRTRAMHGKTLPSIPSLFLDEIECEQVDFGAETVGLDLAGSAPPSKSASSTPKLSGPALTTAAHLLNGERVAVEIPQGFALGMSVRHPRYGQGTVTEITGFGTKRAVTVRFSEDSREEKFRIAHAPLQPIGRR